MKEDLKRLMNEFLDETANYRKYRHDLQFTSDMPPKYEILERESTLSDLSLWLNGKIGGEKWDYTNNRLYYSD